MPLFKFESWKKKTFFNTKVKDFQFIIIDHVYNDYSDLYSILYSNELSKSIEETIYNFKRERDNVWASKSTVQHLGKGYSSYWQFH